MTHNTYFLETTVYLLTSNNRRSIHLAVRLEKLDDLEPNVHHSPYLNGIVDYIITNI